MHIILLNYAVLLLNPVAQLYGFWSLSLILILMALLEIGVSALFMLANKNLESIKISIFWKVLIHSFIKGYLPHLRPNKLALRPIWCQFHSFRIRDSRVGRQRLLKVNSVSHFLPITVEKKKFCSHTAIDGAHSIQFEYWMTVMAKINFLFNQQQLNQWDKRPLLL